MQVHLSLPSLKNSKFKNLARWGPIKAAVKAQWLWQSLVRNFPKKPRTSRSSKQTNRAAIASARSHLRTTCSTTTTWASELKTSAALFSREARAWTCKTCATFRSTRLNLDRLQTKTWFRRESSGRRKWSMSGRSLTRNSSSKSLKRVRRLVSISSTPV